MKYSIYLAAACMLAAIAPAMAQQKTSEDWLKAHNQYRKEVGNDDLKWSASLATSAEGYAKTMASKGGECIYNHKLYGDTWTKGENIGASIDKDKTAAQVIAQMMEEKPNFDKTTQLCKPNTVCGHYTAVLSQRSKEVGCGQAACKGSDGHTVYMYVCRYDPMGNARGAKGYVGLFKTPQP